MQKKQGFKNLDCVGLHNCANVLYWAFLSAEQSRSTTLIPAQIGLVREIITHRCRVALVRLLWSNRVTVRESRCRFAMQEDLYTYIDLITKLRP